MWFIRFSIWRSLFLAAGLATATLFSSGCGIHLVGTVDDTAKVATAVDDSGEDSGDTITMSASFAGPDVSDLQVIHEGNDYFLEYLDSSDGSLIWQTYFHTSPATIEFAITVETSVIRVSGYDSGIAGDIEATFDFDGNLLSSNQTVSNQPSSQTQINLAAQSQ